jgi:hypothetical protein
MGAAGSLWQCKSDPLQPIRARGIRNVDRRVRDIEKPEEIIVVTEFQHLSFMFPDTKQMQARESDLSNRK